MSSDTSPETPFKVEEVIDPDLPIIDAHHHLWDRPGQQYLLDDIRADAASGHNITATVYMESGVEWRQDGPKAMRPVGETEFASAIAAAGARAVPPAPRFCAAIIGYADLRLPEIDSVLDAHVAAGNGRFRGIRQRSYWDESPDVMRHFGMRPDRGLLGDSRFREGFACLASKNLTFDAVLFYHQIPELTDLARTFPNVPIVLNHLGFPLGVGPYAGRRSECFGVWRRFIAELATCPNVHVKIGGMGMPIWGFAFEHNPIRARSEVMAAAWRPYVDTCLESFHPRRCIMESNFPVDAASANYRICWNALKRVTSDQSQVAKREMFASNASKFYGLDYP